MGGASFPVVLRNLKDIRNPHGKRRTDGSTRGTSIWDRGGGRAWRERLMPTGFALLQEAIRGTIFLAQTEARPNSAADEEVQIRRGPRVPRIAEWTRGELHETA